MDRTLKIYGDMRTWFASEEGKNYRGMSQDLDPVFNHVRHMDAKVNGAPQRGNKGWKYAGSIPVSVMVDWLRKNGYTMDQWARNEDGAKDKFKKFIRSREYHKLFAHNQRLN